MSQMTQDYGPMAVHISFFFILDTVPVIAAQLWLMQFDGDNDHSLNAASRHMLQL